MKYLLTFLAILLVLPILVYVAGALVPETHSVSASRTFDVPPDSVWHAIRDVREYPSWRTGVRRVEILSRSGEPLKWKEYYQNHNPITFRRVSSAGDSVYSIAIADDDLPYAGTWRFRLKPSIGGYRLDVTEEGEIYNPIFRFISYFIMGYRGTMTRFLSDLEQKLTERS